VGCPNYAEARLLRQRPASRFALQTECGAFSSSWGAIARFLFASAGVVGPGSLPSFFQALQTHEFVSLFFVS
jgi:hypothetical protein